MREDDFTFFPEIAAEDKQVKWAGFGIVGLLALLVALSFVGCDAKPAYTAGTPPAIVQDDPVDLIACNTLTIADALAKGSGEFDYAEHLEGMNAKKLVASVFGSAPKTVSDVLLLGADSIEFVRVVIFENGCGVAILDLPKDAVKRQGA